MHYSLVFETNSLDISADSSEEATGTPVSAGASLQDVVAKALREEASLPVDLDSLKFQPG